jgi:anthranilate synthase component 2
MLTVIDNYDSFTYNLVQFLGDLGHACNVIRNDEKTVNDVLASKPEAVILSPGPCTPDQAGICVDLVRDAPLSLPILGVCLGHQSIGQAFGGKVIRAPVIMHGKLSPISHQGDGLFKNLQSPINVTRYHSLIVERETLPANLKVAAETYDGTIMAVEHIDRPVFGVQFHPESIASQAGHQILSNFLEQAGLSSKDVTMPQFDLSNIG